MRITTKTGKAYIFYDPKITPKDKKYSAYTPKGKLIHFGARSYDQYKDRALGLYKAQDHKDKVRRKNYRTRHRSDYHNNPEYPGYYSWNFLW